MFKLSVVLILIVGLSACQPNDSGGAPKNPPGADRKPTNPDGNAGDDSRQPTNPPPTENPDHLYANSLTGKWVGPCKVDPSDRYSTGTRDVLSILGDKVEIRSFEHPLGGTDCSFAPYQRHTRSRILSKESVSREEAVFIIDGIRYFLKSNNPNIITSEDGEFHAVSRPEKLPFEPKYATSCPNLSGYWQMNNFYFHAVQHKCESFLYHSEGVPNWSGYYSFDFDFYPDGVTWKNLNSSMNVLWQRSYFTENELIQERMLSSNSGPELQIKKHFLSKRPCNLMNPDGADYYTVEYFNKDGKKVDCAYYARQRQPLTAM